jgi:hypothetical protein
MGEQPCDQQIFGIRKIATVASDDIRPCGSAVATANQGNKYPCQRRENSFLRQHLISLRELRASNKNHSECLEAIDPMVLNSLFIFWVAAKYYAKSRDDLFP